MDLFWPDSFDEQLDRLERDADSGDARARAVFEYVVSEMDYLRRHIRSRTALRCDSSAGFLPTRKPLVALFSGDKANDVFYDSVGRRADQIIDKWIREGEVDEDGPEIIQEGK